MKTFNLRKGLVIASLLGGLSLASIATLAASDTVELYSSTKNYVVPGTVVRYYQEISGQPGQYQVAHFKSKWYVVAGDKPDFATNAGAWERISPILVHSNNSDTAAITATPAQETWSEKGVYLGGTVVKYDAFCFKAQWWTQGNTPSAGGVWQTTTCPSLAATTLPAAGAAVTTETVQPKPADTATTVSKNDVNQCGSGDGSNIPTWTEDGVYTEGNVVKNGGKYFKAKWRTQNNDPALIGANPWDSPWLDLGSCVPNSAKLPIASNETPTGVPSNTLPQPADTTDKAAENTKNTVSPAIPPVIPADVPASTAVNSPAPTALPADGYEFLRLVTDADWDWMFPLRSGKQVANGGDRNSGNKFADTFTRDNFVKAVLAYNHWAKTNNYKQFLNEGSKKQQAEEFVAFLAKSSRETSGSWSGASAPWAVDQNLGGENIAAWKGGLYWVEEIGFTTNADGTSPYVSYVDAASSYTPAPGRSYYGRGIIQLSWNYNYGAFSEWLFENGLMRDLITAKDTLLKRPDYVATNGSLSFLSGIWFWMTPQGAKPASQDVLLGRVTKISASTQDQGLPKVATGINYTPKTAAGETSDPEVFAYRIGTIINIVNGGLECNKAAAYHEGPVQRVFYYDAYAAYFNFKYAVNATRMPDVKASSQSVWLQKVGPNSPVQLQSATCYNQKSYYGW